MRKLSLFIAIISLVFLLFASGVRAADSSVTTDLVYITGDYFYVSYDWTAASNGSVTSTAGPSVYGYIVLVVTDPGATAPTDDYTITLTDPNSVDVMGGALADCDESNTEQWLPKIGNIYGSRFVNGPLTLNISDNTEDSATGVVYVYMVK